MQEHTPMAGFGVGPDWETFQRVWKRVMPEEENSPIALRTPPQGVRPEPAPVPKPEPRPEEELIQLLEWMCAGVLRAGAQAGKPGALPVWRVLYQQRRQGLRQFGAVYFLRTGTRFVCAGGPRSIRERTDQSLRREYLWERRLEELCRRCGGDGELEKLCKEQLGQSRRRREKIRQTLEHME